MESALQANGRRIFLFGALGGLLFGYDTGVISGAILFIKDDFGLSPFMQGAIVAALLLGAMVGAGFAGPLSDRIGRRRLIIVAAVPIVMHVPADRAMPSSISAQACSSMLPARSSAQYFQVSEPEPSVVSRQWPESIGPAGR